ncbi:MAG: hypothetical protein V7K18_25410 [Nostoc sp.]
MRNNQSHQRPNLLTPFLMREGEIQSLSTFRGEEWKWGLDNCLSFA